VLKLQPRQWAQWYVLLATFWFFFIPDSKAQVFKNDTLPSTAPQSENIIADSVASSQVPQIMAVDTLKRDTLNQLDNSFALDTLSILDSLTVDTVQVKPPRRDIETTINYSARDSIYSDLINQRVYLYGDAKIDYGKVRLKADKIEIDYIAHTLSAAYSEDSLGNKIGVPVFSDGPETYETQNIVYNFETQKAYITGVVTKQGDAFMHGAKVKKTPDNELFIKSAKYTTCNLPNPHYHIQASKLKIIPNDKLVSGPFNLQFSDVPTPLGFAFGMFPSPKKRSSGVLFPSYGEQRNRGFFLKNGGYYFAISDYIDLKLTGEIYSKGGHGFNTASSYVKRYAYRGNFNFRFNKFKTGAEDTEQVSNDFWVNWRHSPLSKGRSSVSASVSAGSSSFNKNNVFENSQRNVTTNFNSNVSYRTSIKNTPFNFSMGLRHNQNVQTGQVDFTLPNSNFTMNQIYPLKKKGSTKNNPLTKLNLRYSMNLNNRISNKISSDSIAPFNTETIPDLFAQARNGMKHQIPVSTSMRVLKNFTFTPSVNYTELWYLKKLNYRYDEGTNQVITDTLEGFTRAYFYSSGASISTRLYGTIYFKGEKIQAIRHVLTPSIGLGFQPDFSEEKFDFYQEVQTDQSGTTRKFSRYNGFIFGSPPTGKSTSLGFSLTNNLEMKVKSKKDTTGKSKKIKLIDNFSISSGYNFAADSFQLSNINLGLRTKVFSKRLSINLTSTIDPYIYVLDTSFVNNNDVLVVKQRRLDKFAWDSGRGLGQIIASTLSLSTRLDPDAFRFKQQSDDEDVGNIDLVTDGRPGYIGEGLFGDWTEEEGEELELIRQNPELYVDFKVPWSLSIRYNVNFRKKGFEEGRITQTLSFNGDLKLTENTRIGFRSGYDFEAKDLTQTSINIFRNLHCWEMSLNWIPFGRFTSYNFTVRVKSALLQDLQINRRNSFTDNF